MAKTVGEYLELYLEWGRSRFAVEFTAAALVGVGMSGGLGDPKEDLDGTLSTHLSVSEMAAKGGLAGRVWSLQRARNEGQSEVVVGRSSESDIVIPEYSLSRRHCAFRTFGGDQRVVDMTQTIVDLGSTNGSCLRGEPLIPAKPTRLRDQDDLVLGRYRFQFFSNRAFIALLKRMAEEATEPRPGSG